MGIDQSDKSLFVAYGFSLAEVINLGRLVKIAYKQFNNPPNKEIASNPKFPTPFLSEYKPIANLCACDSTRSTEKEFYGHLSWNTNEAGHLVISIRGTSNAQEWEDDAKFFKTKYPYDKKIGEVELGFAEIFSSFTVSEPGNTQKIKLFDYLDNMQEIEQITVVGHSLGSSLATLVATEIARREISESIRLLTFASPLVGDTTFVKYVESKISKSLRIVNKPDLVPNVPPKILGFRHINHKYEVNSHPNQNIKHSIICFHSLDTYLHMLDATCPIQESCQSR